MSRFGSGSVLLAVKSVPMPTYGIPRSLLAQNRDYAQNPAKIYDFREL